MVREVPDYAQQYLIEHPEFDPPLDTCGAGAPAREAETSACSADIFARQAEASPCSADTPLREAGTKAVVQPEAQAAAQPAKQPASPESAATEPAAKRRKNTAHGASRGTEAENNPAPKERKNPRHESADDSDSKEYDRIKEAQAAIPGALAGDWRDLRTVFEFAGICQPIKKPSQAEYRDPSSEVLGEAKDSAASG
jgi:hypothetical protein